MESGLTLRMEVTLQQLIRLFPDEVMVTRQNLNEACLIAR